MPGMFCKRNDGFKHRSIVFDTKIEEYVLSEVIVRTGDGEDDFVVDYKPKLVDKYDLDEVIQVRSEGCNVKEICKRIQDGEILPSGRSPQYVDATKTPQTLEEALDLKKKTELIIENAGVANMSKEQLEALGTLAKMTDEDRNIFIENFIKNKNAGETTPAETTPAETKPAGETGE